MTATSAPELPADASQPAHPILIAPLKGRELLAAMFSGIMTALAFPGSNAVVFAWIGLALLCIVAFQPRRKRAMATIFGAFGLGFYLTLLYWFLAMHPLTWLGFTYAQSIGVVTFSWLGASAILTLQLMIFGFVYGYLTQRWTTPSWKHVVALALGWTTLEWLSSLGPFGFTWGNLALTQYQTLPMIQVLNLVGPFPLAALIVGVNGAIALTIMRQKGKPFSLQHFKPIGVSLVPVAAVLGYGAYGLSHPLPQTTFATEIVQGNFAGGDKWEKGMDPRTMLNRTMDKYLKLTGEHTDTSLVIWPETAIPTYIRADQQNYMRLMHAAMDEHRYLMTGTIDWEGDPRRDPASFHPFNAVTVFGPHGENLGFDYKRHLVPFGEYVPWRDQLPNFIMQSFGLINIVGHDFAPGINPHIFDLPFAKVGTGVCYDGIFPDAMRPAVLNGAQVLALVTNDSWYKDTTAPRVLEAHAALRAVENDRYVLRAANTGICSVIEPTGRIVGSTPVFQDATLVGRAAPISDLTLYTRWGNWAAKLAGLGFLGFLVVTWTNRRRNRQSKLA